MATETETETALGKIADLAKYLSEPAWNLEGCALVGVQIHELATAALDRVRAEDREAKCDGCA